MTKTPKEHKQIPASDFGWRCKAVTTVIKDSKVNRGGSEIKKGDTIYSIVEVSYKKGSVDFPLLDITSLFLNLSYESYQKAFDYFNKIPIKQIKKRKQLVQIDENIINYYESLFSSIIFSYTAIESFANQNIPDDYIYEFTDRDGKNKELNKVEIEKTLSPGDKILYILPGIFEIKFSKQKQAWHEYKKLKRFRDRIIHPKTEDTKSALKDTNTIWNDLFSDQFIEPHKLAYRIMKEFIANTNVIPEPRWYTMYPSHMK